MGVAADELLSQGLQHVLDSEGLPLAPDLGVKEYLKQHVAQLLFELCLVLLLDRFEDLVGLFDQVRLEGLAGLLARSEERRVGKECRFGGWRRGEKKTGTV